MEVPHVPILGNFSLSPGFFEKREKKLQMGSEHLHRSSWVLNIVKSLYSKHLAYFPWGSMYFWSTLTSSNFTMTPCWPFLWIYIWTKSSIQELLPKTVLRFFKSALAVFSRGSLLNLPNWSLGMIFHSTLTSRHFSVDWWILNFSFQPI